MKEIFQALVRVVWSYWDRRRRSPVSIGYLFVLVGTYMIICVSQLHHIHQLRQRLDFFEDLSNRQALQLAAKGVIDYHVDTTHEDPDGIDALHGDVPDKVPSTDEGPPLRRTLDGSETEWKVYGNKWTTTGPHAVHAPVPTLYQLCRANHGTRSQCRAESRWSHHACVGDCERLYQYSHAMIGDPLRASLPNPPVEEENTDRSEGTAATYRGELGELHLLNLGSDVAGVWTCNRDATAPFGLRCDFRSWAPTGPASSDSSPSHIETHFDDGMLCIACGPLGQGAQPEGVDTLQTTGPMPVKVCKGGTTSTIPDEDCRVLDGKWTIDPASDSDGNQGAAVLRER